MTPEWESAALRGSIAELRLLLANGADINARNDHGQTALMIAACEGLSEAAGWLIDSGADLDRTAKYGLTALMLAVVRGHVEVVRRLTAAGADLGIRGTGAPGFAAKTALDLAIARDDRSMMDILRAGAGHRDT